MRPRLPDELARAAWETSFGFFGQVMAQIENGPGAGPLCRLVLIGGG
jgi:hypothetical protein